MTLPVLNGPEDLDGWRSALKRILFAEGLRKHIDEEVPEPDSEQDPHAHAKWCLERGYIDHTLCESIGKQAIKAQMRANGWDEDNINPYETYKHIVQALGQAGGYEHGQALIQFAGIQRDQFDSCDAFISRLTSLHAVVQASKLKLSDEVCLHFAVNAVKRAYPSLWQGLTKDLTEGKLSWKLYLEYLQRQKSIELASYDMVVIPDSRSHGHKDRQGGNARDHRNGSPKSSGVGSNSTNYNSRASSPTGGPGPKVKCQICGGRYTKDHKHCNECGKGHAKKVCWYCYPEQAPKEWVHKEVYMLQNQLRRTGTGTTAIAHQNSGITAPANLAIGSGIFTPATSTTLATLPYNLLNDEEPMLESSFHESPRPCSSGPKSNRL